MRTVPIEVENGSYVQEDAGGRATTRSDLGTSPARLLTSEITSWRRHKFSNLHGGGGRTESPLLGTSSC